MGESAAIGGAAAGRLIVDERAQKADESDRAQGYRTHRHGKHEHEPPWWAALCGGNMAAASVGTPDLARIIAGGDAKLRQIHSVLPVISTAS
jgi:hypothetical protein